MPEVNVKTFTDGPKLLAHFEAAFREGTRIPLCMLDMRMLPIDGLKTAELLRAIDPDVVIIIITAHSDVTPAEVRARLRQDIYYVKKPFNDDELVALVSSLIKGWQRLQSLRERTRQLNHEASLLHALMNSLPDAIYFKDRASRFLRVNQGFRDVLSLAAGAEIAGKTDLDLQPKELAEAFLAEERAIIETGQPIIDRIEYNPAQDGTPRWLSATKVPIIGADGQIEGIVGISRDITVHKQGELKLRATLERERELHNLRKHFIRMVSHEFRNPLATIQSACEVLQGYQERMTPEQIRHRIEKIGQQVRNLLGLQDDVLALEYVQSLSKNPTLGTLNPTWIDLIAFCNDLIDDLRDVDHGKHEIILESPYSELKIFSHEKLLRLIVTNLVTNALKYSPEGSTVRVRLDEEPNRTKLQVEDHGIGIPEDEVAFLFEPFHRASNVGNISGSGLGLAITRDAVTLHGGTLELTSQVDGGSTFTVRFPHDFAFGR
jgi:PAS domain S-box-containing protein